MSIVDWNESQVNQFFISLGLNRYELAIKEHGLTGDVLVHLDNDLLKDIGIQSVGKRLAILKAIYKLKLKDDIPIEDGQWVPPLGDLEQDESDDSHSSSSVLTPPQQHHQQEKQQKKRSDSISDLFQIRDEKIKTLEMEVKSIKSEFQSFASRFMASTPNSPNAVEILQRTSSTRAQGRHMREESICQLDIPDPSPASPSHIHQIPSISQDDPRPSRAPSPVPSSVLNTAQESNLPLISQQESNPPLINPQEPSHQPIPSQETPPSPKEEPVTVTPKPKEKPTKSDSLNSHDKDPNNPYKSFRVTLEDPCYKVLPAALKKYKIKEHYKNYVLFICYGKQERCLSYEEKPLLLFQKLKEAHQNPVFTLRHIKDIESPVSLALAKQAQRKEKKLAAAAQKIENSSNSKDGAEVVHKPRKTPPNSGLVEEASGFCIAIYPYMSEQDDDLDVGVGDTFIIVGKSKGWWVVTRDKGEDSKLSEENKGWIPSGCLLQTTRSFTIGTTGKIDYQTKILPEEILSVGSASCGLMDYKPKGVDEVGFDINDSLKVYKKYNNWSYVINESKPEKPRGWVPSWLIGARKEKDTQALSPNSIITDASSASTNTTGPNNSMSSKLLKPKSSSSSMFSSQFSSAKKHNISLSKSDLSNDFSGLDIASQAAHDHLNQSDQIELSNSVT